VAYFIERVGEIGIGGEIVEVLDDDCGGEEGGGE